jgi:hypothetical protein
VHVFHLVFHLITFVVFHTTPPAARRAAQWPKWPQLPRPRARPLRRAQGIAECAKEHTGATPLQTGAFDDGEQTPIDPPAKHARDGNDVRRAPFGVQSQTASGPCLTSVDPKDKMALFRTAVMLANYKPRQQRASQHPRSRRARSLRPVRPLPTGCEWTRSWSTCRPKAHRWPRRASPRPTRGAQLPLAAGAALSTP